MLSAALPRLWLLATSDPTTAPFFTRVRGAATTHAEPSAALEAARALMHEVSVSQEGGLTHRERLQLGLVEANAQLITTSTFAPR